ncbi:MAG: hypothetical protein AAFP85_16120 [Pseudomonadota bacterium]
MAVLFWGIIAANDPVLVPIIVGTLIAGGSLYFRMLCADVTLMLDRRSGVVQVEWVQMWRTKTRKARIDEIDALVVEGDDEAERLAFRLTAGKTLPLVPFLYTGGDHPKVRTAINAWLAQT